MLVLVELHQDKHPCGDSVLFCEAVNNRELQSSPRTASVHNKAESHMRLFKCQIDSFFKKKNENLSTRPLARAPPLATAAELVHASIQKYQQHSTIFTHYVCLCVKEEERERERESACVCVCVYPIFYLFLFLYIYLWRMLEALAASPGALELVSRQLLRITRERECSRHSRHPLLISMP